LIDCRTGSGTISSSGTHEGFEDNQAALGYVTIIVGRGGDLGACIARAAKYQKKEQQNGNPHVATHIALP